MIVEHAYAKLNLCLDVIGKRADGYHDLQMIVVPLQLSDILSFEKANEMTLEADVNIEHNAILKTALLMKERYHIDENAKITLQKHIPIGSGLGGESADIAATIRGLNKLWSLGLNHEALEDLALSLGSDTLFCLYNKTARVTGRGEHLEFLEKPMISNIYLCVSNHPISTKKSFENYVKTTPEIPFETLLQMYKNKDFKAFFKQSFNGLLETAFLLDKTLKNTYYDLKNHYKNAYMTGSGSTLFVIEFSEKSVDLDEIKTISKRNVIKTTIFD